MAKGVEVILVGTYAFGLIQGLAHYSIFYYWA